MTAINVRVTKSEIQQANLEVNNETVQLLDGGYVAVLSVMHDLHCLVSRQGSVHSRSFLRIFRNYLGPTAQKHIPRLLLSERNRRGENMQCWTYE